MKIKSAQYIKTVRTPFDGKEEKVNVTVKVIEELDDGSSLIHFVPMTEGNRHYAEILKQVKEGKLTIKEAE
jgi:hypothetical protein